mmetsp:Transcript_9732/g.21677  ORF Transcript_9732/g.21677 Transcript_9732/m.21677 type:complete len:1357 (-) Transcript_9732:137-4207(-)|eukprot:CAMPEP_0113303560 /NCGR_PEP_ID=MMETSP0010_2-20120614/3927_1 /TAXON_ID=216773 ORGANISM="Corethron hystrix, Strain 308" /NCGR_SAMPLE_ID=MMETSP0010_2 /ASSEMBLY_ACC=CAM_ASM_000155 /LENGTH=1356 /DNA_ID=CAMNT_0000157581 /DNA_START=69 /DNA_END=4139 /DNA_ORIENTATION=- /assembly_acc=CAM_ASM_000155
MVLRGGIDGKRHEGEILIGMTPRRSAASKKSIYVPKSPGNAKAGKSLGLRTDRSVSRDKRGPNEPRTPKSSLRHSMHDEPRTPSSKTPKSSSRKVATGLRTPKSSRHNSKNADLKPPRTPGSTRNRRDNFQADSLDTRKGHKTDAVSKNRKKNGSASGSRSQSRSREPARRSHRKEGRVPESEDDDLSKKSKETNEKWHPEPVEVEQNEALPTNAANFHKQSQSASLSLESVSVTSSVTSHEEQFVDVSDVKLENDAIEKIAAKARRMAERREKKALAQSKKEEEVKAQNRAAKKNVKEDEIKVSKRPIMMNPKEEDEIQTPKRTTRKNAIDEDEIKTPKRSMRKVAKDLEDAMDDDSLKRQKQRPSRNKDKDDNSNEDDSRRRDKRSSRRSHWDEETSSKDNHDDDSFRQHRRRSSRRAGRDYDTPPRKEFDDDSSRRRRSSRRPDRDDDYDEDDDSYRARRKRSQQKNDRDDDYDYNRRYRDRDDYYDSRRDRRGGRSYRGDRRRDRKDDDWRDDRRDNRRDEHRDERRDDRRSERRDNRRNDYRNDGREDRKEDRRDERRDHRKESASPVSKDGYEKERSHKDNQGDAPSAAPKQRGENGQPPKMVSGSEDFTMESSVRLNSIDQNALRNQYIKQLAAADLSGSQDSARKYGPFTVEDSFLSIQKSMMKVRSVPHAPQTTFTPVYVKKSFDDTDAPKQTVKFSTPTASTFKTLTADEEKQIDTFSTVGTWNTAIINPKVCRMKVDDGGYSELKVDIGAIGNVAKTALTSAILGNPIPLTKKEKIIQPADEILKSDSRSTVKMENMYKDEDNKSNNTSETDLAANVAKKKGVVLLKDSVGREKIADSSPEHTVGVSLDGRPFPVKNTEYQSAQEPTNVPVHYNFVGFRKLFEIDREVKGKKEILPGMGMGPLYIRRGSSMSSISMRESGRYPDNKSREENIRLKIAALSTNPDTTVSPVARKTFSENGGWVDKSTSVILQEDDISDNHELAKVLIETLEDANDVENTMEENTVEDLLETEPMKDESLDENDDELSRKSDVNSVPVVPVVPVVLPLKDEGDKGIESDTSKVLVAKPKKWFRFGRLKKKDQPEKADTRPTYQKESQEGAVKDVLIEDLSYGDNENKKDNIFPTMNVAKMAVTGFGSEPQKSKDEIAPLGLPTMSNDDDLSKASDQERSVPNITNDTVSKESSLEEISTHSHKSEREEVNDVIEVQSTTSKSYVKTEIQTAPSQDKVTEENPTIINNISVPMESLISNSTRDDTARTLSFACENNSLGNISYRDNGSDDTSEEGSRDSMGLEVSDSETTELFNRNRQSPPSQRKTVIIQFQEARTTKIYSEKVEVCPSAESTEGSFL